jgi:N-acetylmuramoyl-L-alanine amidase
MSEKRKFLVFRIICILLFLGSMAHGQKVNTVVLDAGHGGHDTGALGKHSREKDITLAIILKLRDYIHENLKDVKVILTRDNDEFIELYRRAKIANESKADLFISVHCNANPSPTPFGTETYVMGLHKSNANLAVAKAENAAILLEDDYVEQYDGFDPNSAEGNIFFSMMQNAFLDRSLDFAGRVEKQFREKLNFFSRGVKQAGFLVLYKTAMPGVLIETGFLSNSKDEKFLLSEKGQDQVAYSIFRAFREYKYTVEKRDLSAFKDTDTLMVGKRSNAYVAAPVSKGIDKKTESKSVPDKVIENAIDKVIYRVQFATSPLDKPIDSPDFEGMPDIWKYFQNGVYKFTAGKFDSVKQATSFRQEVVSKGFTDAFVVPFYNDKRITIEEARRLAGK